MHKLSPHITRREKKLIFFTKKVDFFSPKKLIIFSFSFQGRPEPVSNCSQTNHSADAIHISCTPGYDGGLSQIFTLELYAINQEEKLEMSPSRNVTSLSPKFVVRHLNSASVFEARVYSSNKKGRSLGGEAVVLRVSTLKRPSEKRLATTASGGGKKIKKKVF